MKQIQTFAQDSKRNLLFVLEKKAHQMLAPNTASQNKTISFASRSA
jgi:hypothetical protein